MSGRININTGVGSSSSSSSMAAGGGFPWLKVAGGVAVAVVAAGAIVYFARQRHAIAPPLPPSSTDEADIELGLAPPSFLHSTQPPVDLSHVHWEDMMLGIAIGDSFGAGLEFRSREWIDAHVDFTSYVNAREGLWTEGFTDGKYTDDTEMTLGLIKALVETSDLHSVDEDVLLAYWHNEYERGKEKNGYGRQGHGSIKKFYSGEKTIEEIRSFQRDRDYPGNAPPMRAIPLGFLPEDYMETLSRANADATHPHPKCRAASLLVARAARHLAVERKPHSTIIQTCSLDIQHFDEETLEYLEKVDKLPDYHSEEIQENFLPIQEILCGPQPLPSPFNGAPCYGLNSDSMRTAGCALYLLKWHRDVFESLKESIRMGGDVDSLASIVLGILGARYGLEGLPQWLFEPLEEKEYLRSTARDFKRFVETLYSASASS